MKKILLPIDGTMRSIDAAEFIAENFNPNDVQVTAGEEIVFFAKENDIDTIVMTKSSKRGIKNFIGSVAAYVVSHSGCTIYSIPENDNVA